MRKLFLLRRTVTITPTPKPDINRIGDRINQPIIGISMASNSISAVRIVFGQLEFDLKQGWIIRR